MLSCVPMVGKNEECGVIEKLRFHRERHENTIALPLANCGYKVGRQSGWKKKANVLLVEILERYHVGLRHTSDMAIRLHWTACRKLRHAYVVRRIVIACRLLPNSDARDRITRVTRKIT